jgi:AraC-like DNA-binding protein
VHVAQIYGGMRPASRLARGGLAPWQERRAKEFLRADITHGVALKEVARECGISVGYFSHAFRRTLGVAPHRWLIEQRVVLSKEKLRDDGLSLSDVATECGFSDQKSPHASFQANGRCKSGRVASGSQAIASEHRNYKDPSKKSGYGNIECGQRFEWPYRRLARKRQASHRAGCDPAGALATVRTSLSYQQESPRKRSPEPREDFTRDTALTGKSGRLARPPINAERKFGDD